jgi:hypothetical protein
VPQTSRIRTPTHPGWSTKYLDSVADHEVHHLPGSNLPFHPIVLSLGGMMDGSTTKVFASWKRVMTCGTYNLMLTFAGEGPQF